MIKRSARISVVRAGKRVRRDALRRVHVGRRRSVVRGLRSLTVVERRPDGGWADMALLRSWWRSDWRDSAVELAAKKSRHPKLADLRLAPTYGAQGNHGPIFPTHSSPCPEAYGTFEKLPDNSLPGQSLARSVSPAYISNVDGHDDHPLEK